MSLAAVADLIQALNLSATTAPIANPYDIAVAIGLGNGTGSVTWLETFLFTILMECFLVNLFVASDGLEVALEHADLRSQGLVFQHIVRPARHGYLPVAYVLTLPVQGEHGISYEGVVADVRQGDNGELKLISLAEPQRFLYRRAPADPSVAGSEPTFQTSDREWLGGVVALDAAAIRNVVVHSIPPALVEAVEIDVLPEEASRE